MKMYCKIKRPDNARYSFAEGKEIIVQEKLDGSNTAIMNDNGVIRYFSRSNELKGEEGLGGFKSYMKKYENKIKEYLPSGWVIYGEWLEQGKINYNSLAKQGKITPYYAFDLVSEIKLKEDCNEEDEEKFERKWESIEKMKERCEYYIMTGELFAPIVVNKEGYLIDGYTSYLIAVADGIKKVSVEREAQI